ncbi:MAG: fibronectin type III domain-containing protein [Candidatus Saccharimonas sp.]
MSRVATKLIRLKSVLFAGLLSAVLIVSGARIADAAATYSLVALNANVSGTSVTASATIKTSYTVWAQLYGVCVRAVSNNANRDFNFISTNITTTGTAYTSQTRSFSPGTYKYYACVNAEGSWRDIGASKTFTVGSTTLPETTVSTSNVGTTQVTLHWAAVAGATGYRVGYTGGGSWETTDGASATSRVFTGLTPNTAYGFYVQPLPGGVTKTIHTTTAQVPSTPPPTGFSLASLDATVSGTSVVATTTVTSNPQAAAQLYGICVRSASNANLDLPFVSATITPQGTLYTSPSRTFAVGTYTYFACLYSQGVWHNVGASKQFTVAGTTTPTPGATTAIVSEVGQTKVTLNWTQAQNATGYRIGYQATANAPAWETTAGASATSQVITGLSSNTTYSMYVQPLPGGTVVALSVKTLADPDPQPSKGNLGMMVFLDPTKPGDFAKDLAAVKETGSTWIRMGIPSWTAGGVVNGQFVQNTANMDYFTNCARQAREAGLKVVLIMADAHNNNAWTEEQFRQYNGQYWEHVSYRLGQYVDLWQVFNEHDGRDYRNHAELGGGGTWFPAGYLERMRLALATANTSVHKYSTAPLTTTPFGYPVNQARYDRWVTFFDGVGSSLDVIGLHMYPEKSQSIINAMPTYMNQLKARYNKPIAVLEFGLPSVAGYGSEAEVGDAVVRQIRAIMSVDPYAATLYQLRDRGTNVNDGEQVFGILRNDWSKKGYYNAVVAEVKHWQ